MNGMIKTSFNIIPPARAERGRSMAVEKIKCKCYNKTNKQ